MQDITRHAQVVAELEASEQELRHLAAAAHPSVREHVLRSIGYCLDDVRRFFLANAERAADVRAEAHWLAHAQAWLDVARQQFDIARAALIVDAHGGPGNARITT